MNSNNLTVTHGYETFEPNDIVEPKKAKMEKYNSSPTVTVPPNQQNMSHNAGGLNASTRSSSPVEGLPLTIGHGMERDKDRATYLQQLIKDQKCCLSYPNVFHHVERLLSEGMLPGLRGQGHRTDTIRSQNSRKIRLKKITQKGLIRFQNFKINFASMNPFRVRIMGFNAYVFQNLTKFG